MTNIENPPAPLPPKASGCLVGIGHFAVSWFLPCFSPRFYAGAMQRRARQAVGFFFIFTLLLTIWQSVIVANLIFRTTNQSLIYIANAYTAGQVPPIVISRGIAEVYGPQPQVLATGAPILVATDLAGTLPPVDRQHYLYGCVLTRTSLRVWYQGFYEELSLGGLQQLTGLDPVVIVSGTISNYAGLLATGVWAVVSILLLVWNTVVQFGFVLVVGLLMAGVLALVRPATRFRPVLIAGLYAVVPATYLSLILTRGFGYPGLALVWLIPIWALVLLLAWAVSRPGRKLKPVASP
jgi:hypothetical protein